MNAVPLVRFLWISFMIGRLPCRVWRHVKPITIGRHLRSAVGTRNADGKNAFLAGTATTFPLVMIGKAPICKPAVNAASRGFFVMLRIFPQFP
ncbi:MAG: hypothetical protein ACRYGK_04100 [Janthinobacterium lividum]